MAIAVFRKRWTAKPPLGVQINWSHPLSKDLVGCYLCNEGGGVIHDLVSGAAFSTLGTPDWFVDKGVQGARCNANDTGYFVNANQFQMPTKSVSLFWRGVHVGTPTLSANIASCSYTNTNTAPFAAYGIFHSNAGTIDGLWNNGTLQTIGSGVAPEIGVAHNWIFVIDGTTSLASIGQDGKKLAESGAGVGTITYGATPQIRIGQNIAGLARNPNILTDVVYVWANRAIFNPEFKDLTRDPYALLSPQAPPRLYFLPPPPAPAPSSDYIFYDTHPYARASHVRQEAFTRAQRNTIADASWAFQISAAVPSQAFIFYDSYSYDRTRLLRQQVFPRDVFATAAFVAEVPSGPAPSSDYFFYDGHPYNLQKFLQANLNRNSFGDGTGAFFNPPPVPAMDFLFYDGHPYNQAALLQMQSRFERNRVEAIDTVISNFPLSTDWIFYDREDYRGRALRPQTLFERSLVVRGNIGNLAAAVPSQDFHYYDNFPYAQPKLSSLNWNRNWTSDPSPGFFVIAPAPSIGYLFYDVADYRALANLARQARFERNTLAEVPPGTFLAGAVPSVAGWLPVVIPISIPVRQRTSDFVIGLPNDIRDGTLLPGWNFLQLGETARAAYMQALQVRLREALKQEPPFRNPGTFLSVLFQATMQPFSATLTRAIAHNFNAVMAPFQPTLSVFSPNPANVVGFVFSICRELHSFAITKFRSGSICTDVRSTKVPANTQVICKTFSKDPQATTDFSFDWTDPLGTDTIASSIWTADAGITVVRSNFTGAVATVFLSGGTEGTNYSVTNTVTTAGGRTLAANFVLAVKLR